MKALYLNMNPIFPELYDETITFYSLFLIAEQSSYCCRLSEYAMDWNKRNRWDDNFIIDKINCSVNLQETNKAEVKQWILQTRANIKKIKRRKQKQSGDIHAINRYRSMVEDVKKFIIYDYENILNNAWILNWIDLFEPDTVNLLQFYSANNSEKVPLNYYSELIKNNILSGEEFLYFNPLAFDYLKVQFLGEEINVENFYNTENIYTYRYNPLPSTPKEQIKKIKLNLWQKISFFAFILKYMFSRKLKLPEKPVAIIPDLYSIFLCNLPIGPLLTKEQLKLIRSSLQRKIKTISDMLSEFQSEISQENLNEATKEKVNSFYEKLQPETAILQTHIEKELYFQGLANTTAIYPSLKICAAITSIENITRFYEKNGILLPFQAEALRKDLALHTDINKCKVILYWRTK